MQACIKQGLGGGITQLLQTIRSGLAAVEAQVEAQVEVHAEVPAVDQAEVQAEVQVGRSGGLEAHRLIQRGRTHHPVAIRQVVVHRHLAGADQDLV